MKKTPDMDSRYWFSLIFASVFGANMGDFLSDVLNLGHVSGLPILAGILVCIFFAEKLSNNKSMAYFWASIITIRAAATNIGDIFHDYNLSFGFSVPVTLLALILAVFAWCQFFRGSLKKYTIPVNHYYWFCMFLAGVLGTVAGDAASYALQLGNFYAMLSFGVILRIMLWVGRNGLQTELFYYWATIAVIRSAGTAAGDLFAHKVFGLEWSTCISGAFFVLVTYLFYGYSAKQVAKLN